MSSVSKECMESLDAAGSPAQDEFEKLFLALA